MRCEDLADVLSASASVDSDETDLADRRARNHVESCLRCQAELAQYRRLLKALRTLRSEVFSPAPGLIDDVLASLEDPSERQALRMMLSGRRVAYVGGLAAAGAAGALVLATRSTRSRARRAS